MSPDVVTVTCKGGIKNATCKNKKEEEKDLDGQIKNTDMGNSNGETPS